MRPAVPAQPVPSLTSETVAVTSETVALTSEAVALTSAFRRAAAEARAGL